MGTPSRVKAWHGLIVAALVFAVGFGVGLSRPASAIELPRGIFGGAGGGAGAAGERVIPAGIADEAILRRLVDEARETVRQPAAALNRSGGVRALEDLANAVDTSRGVSLGPNNPARTPGSDTLPLPSFSGINAPVWVSETGPAQVVDDLILWGLTDVRVGLINNGSAAKAAAPDPAPKPDPAPAPAPAPTLAISLATDTPPDASVARGTSAFNVTKINFTASGGDVTVTQIRLTRSGISTKNDVFTTCLVEGTNAPLACPILNDAEAGRPANYTTGFLNWVVRDGQTRTLTVQANVANSAAAGNTFRLGVQNSADVTVQTGTVSGTAIGNISTITAPAPPPSVTITLAPTTPVAANVTPGKTAHNATLVRFTAPAGTSASISAITVTRSGTAAYSTIQNVKIFDNTTGVQLGSTVTSLVSDSVTFNLTNQWMIAAGQNRDLRIVTDVATAAILGTTFQLGIAAGGVASSTGLPVNGSLFTIVPHLSVNIAAGTPGTLAGPNNVQAGTDVSVTLINFYAQPGNNVVLHDVTIGLSGTGNSTDVPSIALFDGAVQVSDFRNAIVLNDGSITYPIVLNPVGQGITVSAGATKALAVRARVASNPTVGHTFNARLINAAGVNATLQIYAGTPASVGGTFPVNGNNFMITATPLPDLSILSLIMSDATPDVGQSITLTGMVYNGGTANAPDSRGRFCLDNSNCLINETGLIYQHGVGTLPLASPTSPPFNTPWIATGGTHTIYFCADITPVIAGFTPVAESDETNNCSATAQFTITAPTLTLARNPVPAAGGTLTHGNDRVLLEVDASMNTGTVRLSRLYVLPATTGNASSIISSLRLQRRKADGTWPNLASNPIVSAVNGRNVYNFAIGNDNPDSDVGTAIVKLRVVANITSCIASAASIDLIVDKTTDVEVTTPPSGFIVSGVPFTQVPRNMTLCPTAALFRDPASITTGQSSTLTWTTTNATSASINQNIGAVTPVASGTRTVSPASTTTYTLTATNASGQTATSTATVTITAPATPARFRAPGTVTFPSVLHSPGTALEFSDFGANSVLGAIPAAQAFTLIENPDLLIAGAPGAEPAGVKIQGITLYNPVTIYDDLLVRGSGNPAREPGNLVVNGLIQSTGNIQTTANLQGAKLNVGAGLDLTTTATQHQITGNLQINPGEGGVIIAGGNLSITGGQINLGSTVITSGGITATSIGRFYTAEADTASATTGFKSASASCYAGDRLIACNGGFGIAVTSVASTVFHGTRISDVTCTVVGQQTAAVSKTLKAQAVCFSPDGPI